MRRLALLLLLAGFIPGCAAPPLPTERPSPVNPTRPGSIEHRVTEHLVLVTDVSGSGYYEATFPEGKALTQALAAALPRRNVRALNAEHYEVGLLVFGGSMRTGAALADFDRAALQTAAAEIRTMGAGLERGGATPLRHIFDEITSAVSGKTARTAVVLISDGVSDYPRRTQQAAQRLAESHPDLCIHTVQLGEDGAGGDNLAGYAALGREECSSSLHASELRSPDQIAAFVAQVMFEEDETLLTNPCANIVSITSANFAFNRADIDAANARRIRESADQLNECPNIDVSVEGHTDYIGSEAYNQALSVRRANAVREYLVRYGVDEDRLTIKGFGKSMPVADNESDEGRAQNRRVELRPLDE